MSVNQPYKRTVRQFVDNHYSEGGRSNYIKHANYCEDPEHYIRAFLIIQKDFLELIDFIEPADINLKTYSYRIHELLTRTCIEIEANFVGILAENGFTKEGNWTMKDYEKVNTTHKLSYYSVKLPIWNGEKHTRTPFEPWNNGNGLSWYQAYNKTKHNRHTEFVKANFKNLTDAICALTILISAQFRNEDFSNNDFLSIGGINDGMETATGGYFRVKYPNNWSENERYEFNWQQLRNKNNPISKYDYNN